MWILYDDGTRLGRFDRFAIEQEEYTDLFNVKGGICGESLDEVLFSSTLDQCECLLKKVADRIADNRTLYIIR